jgi:TPR repeat protein
MIRGARLRRAALALLALATACAQEPQVASPTVSGPIAPGPEREARYNALPSTANDLLALARRGDTLAQYKLALYHDRGLGGAPRNAATAYSWMLAAAQGGDVIAQYGTALYLELGSGVPKDIAGALRWYRRSADADYAPAINNLGLMHERGVGTTQNYAEALALYRRAADRGNAAAQNNLGAMLLEGRGIAANATDAGLWYAKAAVQGNATAQANLASLHLSGRGVPRDDVRAYFWLTLAAARASGDQATKFAEQRDTAAKRLSAETVTRVQAAAKDWKVGSGANAVDGLASGGAERTTGNGTGFFVSRGGHVLTNVHVVENCRNLAVKPPNDAARKAEIVALDKANDLALLKTEMGRADVAVFRAGAYVRQGDGVVAFGYPLATALASEGNLTTGAVTALAGMRDDSRMIQISAPIQPGNSGGAVLDMSGHVVGIVVSKLNALRVAQATGDVPQNVNFAIKTTVARSFLEANGVEFRSAPSGGRLEAADVGERAKRFTLRVDCRN